MVMESYLASRGTCCPIIGASSRSTTRRSGPSPRRPNPCWTSRGRSSSRRFSSWTWTGTPSSFRLTQVSFYTTHLHAIGATAPPSLRSHVAPMAWRWTFVRGRGRSARGALPLRDGVGASRGLLPRRWRAAVRGGSAGGILETVAQACPRAWSPAKGLGDISGGAKRRLHVDPLLPAL